MMWTAIGAASIAAGLALIWSVLVKKFPQLKLIDLSTLARERHAETKLRIIRDRFERSLGSLGERMRALGQAFHRRFGGLYGGLYKRLRQMERNLEEAKPLDAETVEARALALVAEAEALVQSGDPSRAEACYIEILRIDPKRLDAYRGLADVYIAQRLYDQARETLEFLVRLDTDDGRTFERLGTLAVLSGDYAEAEAQFTKSISMMPGAAGIRAELGKVYVMIGEHGKAHGQFREALASEPYNPKYLDYFLETSILVGDLKAAEDAFEILEAANPGNQKLAEFRERIDALRQGPPGEVPYNTPT